MCSYCFEASDERALLVARYIVLNESEEPSKALEYCTRSSLEVDGKDFGETDVFCESEGGLHRCLGRRRVCFWLLSQQEFSLELARLSMSDIAPAVVTCIILIRWNKLSTYMCFSKIINGKLYKPPELP